MSEVGERRLRIGAVNYLNSKPLVEGLGVDATGAELLFDYPSHLADRLAEGDLDAALIPSVEYLRNDEYRIVSDACVATRGPVLSVKLYGRCRFSEVRSLALDEGSRTSVVLARILLSERYGVSPTLVTLPIGQQLQECRADAILVIGDRAIPAPQESFVEIWDLGQEWTQWTGLPFVFALWAARPETDLDRLQSILIRARDLGVSCLEDIARRESSVLGIDHTTADSYLTDNLHFRLGSAERDGLRLFYELASKQGLVPKGKEIVFRHCTPAGQGR
ncbi:MAG: menaquinone biosynthesis protein [Planctomycetaceae bacterium]